MRRPIVLAAAAAALAFNAAPAVAGVIIQPRSVTVDVGGSAPGFDISHIIDQSGLSLKYVSGRTDFDTYVALKPLHSATTGEWLSTEPRTSAKITFDFGEIIQFTGFALWNEDSTSLRQISMSVPGRGGYGGAIFGANVDVFGQAYGPTVSRHQAISARYVTFELFGCDAASARYNGCGIGEVAFNSTTPAPPPGGAVPEPGAWALMIMGFLGAGTAIRRQRRGTLAAA